MTERIQCLICGKWFRSLGRHLRSAHGLSGDEYKRMHDLPMSYPLAASDLREKSSARMKTLRDTGKIVVDQTKLVEAARGSDKSYRCSSDRQAQSGRGRHAASTIEQIPPGGRNARGRDAAQVREYQRKYRRRKQMNSHTERGNDDH